MNVTSVKSRFTGSYSLLILLLVIQFPVMYFIVGGMSKKYSQAEKAADMRKRAVELSYLLSRSVLSGEALKMTVAGIESVSDMISQIATSAEEQSSATDEITGDMDNIAGVAEDDVKAVGEVASATDDMKRLATGLRDLVSNFRLVKLTQDPAGEKGKVKDAKMNYKPILTTAA